MVFFINVFILCFFNENMSFYFMIWFDPERPNRKRVSSYLGCCKTKNLKFWHHMKKFLPPPLGVGVKMESDVEAFNQRRWKWNRKRDDDYWRLNGDDEAEQVELGEQMGAMVVVM